MRVISCLKFLVFALITVLCVAGPSFAQVSIAVTFAPPDLPVYEQPVCPGDGYIWTPGYWAWDGEEYYWVPGTWVEAPEAGYLWTPPYWAWNGSDFVFYDGYWAPEVGFYGGIDYGFGYPGRGFEGGRWDNGHFFYNRAVNNVNVNIIHNVYNTTVVNNQAETRVSFNGGNGGINARPTAQEEAALHARHIPPVAAQTQHVQAARSDRDLRASANNGKPPVAATSRPGTFKGQGAVAASKGGAVHNERPAPGNNAAHNAPPAPENNAVHNAPPAQENNRNARTAVHANELPPVEHPAPENSNNSKAEQKYQQQQQKMLANQEKQRQSLQQKQDNEHQQFAKRNGNDAQKQQMEQRHQQQTQQLSQKQNQEQQKMRAKQPTQHTASKNETKNQDEKR